MKKIIIVLLMAISAFAVSPLEYAGSGTWSGCEALATPVSGDFIYAGFPYGLGVFDVSDSLDCRLVEWEYLGATVADIVLRGSYAYLAAGNVGLAIVDISDPTDLSTVSTLDIGEEAYGIDVEGDCALVAGRMTGLHIIDISSVGAPSEVGFAGLAGGCMDVIADGGFAYVSRGLGGFSIIDFSTPTSPSNRGHYSSSTLIREAAKSGSYVYLAAELSGIIVLDVSDPDSPTPAGTYPAPTGRSLSTITIAGNTAYVGAGNYGILSIDITDPASMSLIDRYPMSTTSVIRVSTDGDILYFSTTEGLQLVDVTTTPSSIAFISRENLHSGIEYVWGSGSKLLTSSGIYGIDGFNMPSPETPNQTFNFTNGNRFYAALYYAHYIYAAEGSDGLGVFRSNSLAEYPDPIRTISIGEVAMDVARVDTMLYVLSTNGVTQLKILNPEEPAIRWDAPSSNPEAMFATESYVYVGDEDDGFLVFETGMMSEVGSDHSAAGYEYSSMTLLGNYIYAAVGSDGLLIFDVSDPSSPLLVSQIDTDDDANGVASADGWLFVAADREGVIPFRIYSPGDSLVEYDAMDTGGRASWIYAADDYVFVADRYAVIVLRNTAASIEECSKVPEDYSLSVWPNPFNASCRIKLPAGSEIEIFDRSGRLVSKLSTADGFAEWKPSDDLGSGVYLFRASAGGRTGSAVYLK